MSSVYSPTPIVPVSGYTLPSDGDPKTAQSVNTALQSLADGVAGLKANMRPSTVFSRTQAMRPMSMVSCSVNTDSRIQFSATGGSVTFELDLPDTAVLTAVQGQIFPAGGHAALPATMPTLALFWSDMTADAFTQIGSTATDTSANTTAYQLVHGVAFAITGLSHTVSRTLRRYTVTVTNESGANSLSGLRVLGIVCTYTMTSHDGAAA